MKKELHRGNNFIYRACVPLLSLLVSCGGGGGDNLARDQTLGNIINLKGSIEVQSGATLSMSALANSRGPGISGHKWTIAAKSNTASGAITPVIQNADCSNSTVEKKPIAGGAIIIAQSECSAWLIVSAAAPSATWTVSSTAIGTDGSSSSASFDLVVHATPLPNFEVHASATVAPALNKPVYLYAESEVDSATQPNIKYSWTQIAGTPVTVGAAESATAVFTPNVAGDYVFMVTGTWEMGDTSRVKTDIVQIHIEEPTPPAASDFAFLVSATAKPGIAQSAEPITLSATISTKPGAKIDSITYNWKKLFGPDVPTTSTTLPIVTLAPELPGKYVWAIEATLKSGNYTETQVAYAKFEVTLNP